MQASMQLVLKVWEDIKNKTCIYEINFVYYK